ncbi:copper chaperone taha [Syncephalis plumigaleata]|nr:copper chaperone taha [Syncephalis plumigaleata]
MAETVYKFSAVMTCGGCSGRIKTALGLNDGATKKKGVVGAEFDIENNLVTITTDGSVSQDDVYAYIQKAGNNVQKL